jgi:hypothetical protein
LAEAGNSVGLDQAPVADVATWLRGRSHVNRHLHLSSGLDWTRDHNAVGLRELVSTDPSKAAVGPRGGAFVAEAPDLHELLACLELSSVGNAHVGDEASEVTVRRWR